MTVRLPSVLATYQCAHSLLCCRPPWRVWISQIEEQVCSTQLKQGGSPDVLEAFGGAIERLGPESALLAQTEDGCTMLDAGNRDCSVHRAAGLQALPLQCRNFPRSVIDTPSGVEVAFHLDCPTVSKLVASDPQPFEWVESQPDWPYPLFNRVGDEVSWETDVTRPFTELESLRLRWWGALAAASDAEHLIGLIEAMLNTPETPDTSTTGRTSFKATFEAAISGMVRVFLERLPERGSRYQKDGARVTEALRNVRSLQPLAKEPEQAVRSFLCAAGLWLAHAGVHDDRPALDGIRYAGSQTALATVLFLALGQLEELSFADRLADSLCVAAHVSRWQQFTTMEWVD